MRMSRSGHHRHLLISSSLKLTSTGPRRSVVRPRRDVSTTHCTSPGNVRRKNVPRLLTGALSTIVVPTGGLPGSGASHNMASVAACTRLEAVSQLLIFSTFVRWTRAPDVAQKAEDTLCVVGGHSTGAARRREKGTLLDQFARNPFAGKGRKVRL